MKIKKYLKNLWYALTGTKVYYSTSSHDFTGNKFSKCKVVIIGDVLASDCDFVESKVYCDNWVQFPKQKQGKDSPFPMNKDLFMN